MLGFINAAEVHVRVAVAFVARSLKSALQPGNGFVDLALHDEIGSDIVVRISKRRIDVDRLEALGNRVVKAAHPTVRPAEKRVGFRGRIRVNRLLVEFDGLVQLLFHLVFVSLSKKPDRAFLACFFCH